MNQSGELGDRMRTAVSYYEAAQRGEISADELRELLLDLQRLENVQLAAHELDQQILFNDCFNFLMSLPIP